MASKETSMSRLLKLAQQFNCFYLKAAIRRPSLSGSRDGYFVKNDENRFDYRLLLQGLYNSSPLSGDSVSNNRMRKGDCRPFVVAGQQVGLIRPDVMTELLSFPEVFIVHSDAVMLNPAFRDYKERTSKVEKVLKDCRSRGTFITLKGWRDESYEVRPVYSEESLLKMDRCATCLFGICNYGVDINGYVNHPDKGLCIWLQRRSKTKQTWPGRWDNMVGGGLSVGFSVLQTAFKEAEEEASITPEMMKNVRPGGCVSFFYESERGLFPNTEFVFDLELPLDFIPKNNDGEVETFELLPAHEALERVLSPEFKTTSCPVVVDFLIRHGYITPDNEPNFPEVVELLHVPLQSVYRNFQTDLKNGDLHQ